MRWLAIPRKACGPRRSLAPSSGPSGHLLPVGEKGPKGDLATACDPTDPTDPTDRSDQLSAFAPRKAALVFALRPG